MGLIVYTGGSFDLVHSGHVKLFERCANLGQVVISLNTDEFIESRKGKPPACNFYERRARLLGCRNVDHVVTNIGGADSKPAIEMVGPDYVAIGSDYASPRADYYRVMGFTQDWLDEREIALVYFPRTPAISSTRIRNAQNL